MFRENPIVVEVKLGNEFEEIVKSQAARKTYGNK